MEGQGFVRVILICNPPPGGYSKDMMTSWGWIHVNYTSRSLICDHLFGQDGAILPARDTVSFPQIKFRQSSSDCTKIFSRWNYFLLRSVFMEPEKALTRMKTKKTKMLITFKNTFCSKSRQIKVKIKSLFWIWNLNLKCNQSIVVFSAFIQSGYRGTRYHFSI